ncbi:MAG: acetyltransferase [Gammaproteobacteria bacterium]|nr:MAG: acetyltransferase [Gammaproteobacteria bacterium]
MYLKQKNSGELIEILDLQALVDPFKTSVTGRYHWGEELQDPMSFPKSELAFPSGEDLPRCWLDPYYRSKG